MEKKKFSLDSSIVKKDLARIEEGGESFIPQVAKQQKSTKTTVELDEDFRNELKVWCAKNNITLKDAFQEFK